MRCPSAPSQILTRSSAANPLLPHSLPMAATSATLSLGFRRFHCRKQIALISLPQTPAKIRSSFRLGDGVGGLQVKRGLSKVHASSVNPPPNPDADKGKATSSSSSVADGPPLATILAGVVVFLLFCWVVGSIIMWIVGLIVNVPPS